jgi:hypothetical protein
LAIATHPGTSSARGNIEPDTVVGRKISWIETAPIRDIGSCHRNEHKKGKVG